MLYEIIFHQRINRQQYHQSSWITIARFDQLRAAFEAELFKRCATGDTAPSRKMDKKQGTIRQVWET